MHTAYKLSALSSAVIAALTIASPLMAAEGDVQEEKQAVEQVADQVGEEVVVRDTRAEAMTSFQQLNRQDIANRPQGDGNITTLLRSNPNVQFSRSSSDSLRMGDIKPSDISIHGNLAYQTNFTIDGISANSDLDPARNSNGTNTTHLDASDEQGFYVDASLIDSVTVYDNNVPVEFGGFTGGVVDTQTRSWNGETHFNVFMRATEAGWSEFISDPQLEADSRNANAARPGQFQTDFEKRTYGFTGEFGVSENVGFVIGYTRRESKIPQYQLADTRVIGIEKNPVYVPPMFPGMPTDAPEYIVTTESITPGIEEMKQTSDNLFLKSTMYISDDTELDISFNYSGYENKAFLPTVSDSSYKDKHDGYGLMASLKHRFESSLWTTTVGYNSFKDKRESESDYWYYITEQNMSEQRYVEYLSGSHGDLESEQNVITAKTKLEFDPIQYQNTSHQFTIGAEFNQTQAEYTRNKDYYRWNLDHMLMPDWFDPSVHTHNQFPKTTRFKAGSEDADFMQIGLYAQHTMEAGDWTFRTGVRGEYDDFTEDFNLAPRFTASWDVFGNQATIATFGANRYYGRNILAYALYKAQNAGLQHGMKWVDPEYPEYGKDFEGIYRPGEEPPAGWEDANDFRGLDSLETPYDDELSLALTQRLPADWLANVTYVHRNGEKGVRSWQTGSFISKDKTERHFANTGKTEHDSVTFSITNTVPMHWLASDHHLRLSVAWQETKSNMGLNNGYNDMENSVEPTFDPNKVFYDGKLIDAEDMDGDDFNIPLRVMLETTHTWNQYGLTWFNFFRWESSHDLAKRSEGGYKSVRNDRGEIVAQYAAYDKVEFGENWAWDTKLQYRPDWARGLEVAFEVTNVLNNKNVVDKLDYVRDVNGMKDTISYNVYEPGRQFWLQMSYNY